MSLTDINNRFQMHFPFLKLKFYPSDHLFKKEPFTSEDYSVTKSLSKLRGDLPAVYEFSPTDSVETFEKHLKENIGMCVHVFRKVNEGWLDTSQTKSLSLDRQNSLGSVQFHGHYNDHTLFL